MAKSESSRSECTSESLAPCLASCIVQGVVHQAIPGGLGIYEPRTIGKEVHDGGGTTGARGAGAQGTNTERGGTWNDQIPTLN